MNVYFCKTNLDMYSEEIAEKLEREGLNVIERHCLGFCGECMFGTTFLLENNTLCHEHHVEKLLQQQQKKGMGEIKI